MFRIECFCDDKSLAKVLWLLQGNVYNLKSDPVVNAAKKAGRVVARSSSVLEAFANYLHDKKITEVTPTIAKAFSNELGRAGNYYSNVIRKAVDAGMISRIGNDYRYLVMIKRTHGGKRKGAGRRKLTRKAKKPTVVATKQEAA